MLKQQSCDAIAMAGDEKSLKLVEELYAASQDLAEKACMTLPGQARVETEGADEIKASGPVPCPKRTRTMVCRCGRKLASIARPWEMDGIGKKGRVILISALVLSPRVCSP